MSELERREFLSLSTLPLAVQAVPAGRKLKVVAVGAHPDDAECGCGGTIALYAGAGHAVTVIYLTRGEAGIGGKSHAEAAAIRSAEAEEACRILGARAVFAGQIDGATEVNKARCSDFQNLLAALAPDIVFAHWPLDTHADHRAASQVAYHAWLALARKPGFYFFEVVTNGGRQTQQFTPTVFVDITATVERKRQAIYAHASQRPDEFHPAHEQLARGRGLDAHCRYAEAFTPAWQAALPAAR